ncbi:hypothetical protein DFP72DRAFT_1071639 [Ephemerocybe angulata]|uniref:Hyaluronan/mRNA-binding protein domain-containing protein n=1 Tax=Ephemerocybe angulata TaxID=980116 RepID=A0A8H6HQ15_9AGAR|nr:hypothetical protein DFP72DRAFT_1071639 [Tulosesus angulatus]
MTRTARSSFPRAIQRDRSQARNGLDPGIRKNGAGSHNWGSLSEEERLEDAALHDENVEHEDVPAAQDVVEDVEFKATPARSEDELKEARKLRKNAFHKKNVDLSAIARSSAAASTSPPSASAMDSRLAQGKNVSDVARIV